MKPCQGDGRRTWLRQVRERVRKRCPGSQAWGARSLGRGARGRVSDMPRRGDCAPAVSGRGTPGSAWRRVPEEGRRVPAWSKLGRGGGVQR